MESAVAQFQNGHVEGTAAQVINQDGFVAVLFQAVCQSGSCRLVDDPQHFQACDLAGILGGLALAVIEISRNSNNGLSNGLAQICFRVGLQLLENHSRNFLRGIVVVVNLFLMVGAHMALDGDDGALRVGDGLALGGFANDTLAVLLEAYNGGSGARPFRIGDNYRFAAFHNGNAGVGSTQVNTDYFTHDYGSSHIEYILTWTPSPLPGEALCP
ncbi:NAD-specific glutamate dehydrogenase [compost metagenome]